VQTADSFEKTQMLGKIEGRRRSLSKLQDRVKDRGAWYAVVRGITKSWIKFSDGIKTNLKIMHEKTHM